MKLLMLLALVLAACAGRASGATTLRGIARDAKGGAVVVTDAGGAIYVMGLESWPADLAGKQVEVSGRLRQRKLIPDPTIGPNGERSAGAEGDQTVIEGATWRAVP